MKKILYFMFILIFLISCQLNTSKTTFTTTTDNFEKDSKANVTYSGGVNNGICMNCSQ